ncbi:hypothetical protein BX666DRAFT_192798 [Dichotomocladium elegans]|nr:hypothetical protein BX666DRAFT_192798 [Dichotomocladium elegans]
MSAEPVLQQQQAETSKVEPTSPLPQEEVTVTAIGEHCSPENNVNANDQLCAQDDQKPHSDGEQERKRFNLFKKPKNFGLFGRSKAATTEEAHAVKGSVPAELPQIEQMDPIHVDHSEVQQTTDDKSAEVEVEARADAKEATVVKDLEAHGAEIENISEEHEQEADENRNPKRISFLSRLLAKKKTSDNPPVDGDEANTDIEQEPITAATEKTSPLESATKTEPVEEEIAAKEKKSPSSPTFGRRLTALFGKKSLKKPSEKEGRPADVEEAGNGKTEIEGGLQGERATTAEIDEQELAGQESKREHMPKKEGEEQKPVVASGSSNDSAGST